MWHVTSKEKKENQFFSKMNFQIGLQKGNRAIKDETQQTLFAKTGGVYDRDTENRQALSKQDIPTSYMKIAIIIKRSRPTAMIKTTTTPWLTLLLVLGKSRVKQNSS